MSNDLPVTPWIDDSMANAPAFVRPIPERHSEASNPLMLFNWWEPERTGDDERDYVAGAQHCLTAIAFSRAGGNDHVIANVIRAMYGRAVGPIEMGFIDKLATLATYGRVPAPLDDSMIAGTIRLCGRSEEEMRFGESEAKEYLDLALSLQCPAIVRDLILNAVNLEMGYGALTFVWTVCGAAIMGSLN